MHRNFSFPLLHCYSAMDVLQMQMQHCNKYQNNQDLSLPSGSDILPIYWSCRANAIYELPINLRYIHKRVPALVDNHYMSQYTRFLSGPLQVESTNYKCCVSVCQLYQVRMAGNTNVFHKWKPWFINMIISFQHIECIFPPSHSTFHAMTSATWTAWRVLLLENQGAGIWGMKTSSGQVKVHWVKVYLSSLRAIGTGDELKHLLSRTQLHLKQNLILKLSIKTSNWKQMLKITSAN